MWPAITTSGLALVARADRRLAEHARTFTRAADGAAAAAVPSNAARTEAGSGVAPAGAVPTGGGDLVDAALGIVEGRAAGAMGVALIAVGRDVEQRLVDVLA